MAGGLALWNGSLIMNGPDVVGIRPDPFGWVMIGLAGIAVLVMVGATIGLFIAWIGAALTTANLGRQDLVHRSPHRRGPQCRLLFTLA